MIVLLVVQRCIKMDVFWEGVCRRSRARKKIELGSFVKPFDEIYLPCSGYKSFHPGNFVPVGASFESAYRLHFCSDRVQYSTTQCVACHGMNGRMWRHLHIWRLEQQYPSRSPSRIICWLHMTQDRLNTRLSP